MTGYPDIFAYPHFALDTETTGLIWWKDSPFCLTISTPDGRDWFIDLMDPNGHAWAHDNLPAYPGTIIGQNLKFDIHMLRGVGITVPTRNVFDTAVAAALIDEHLPHYNLDFLAQKYTGAGKDETFLAEMAALMGGKADKSQMGHMLEAFLNPDGRPLVIRYALRDTRATLNLRDWQIGELQRQQLVHVMDLEMRLLPVLLDMEHRGVRVDVERAERAVPEVTEIIDRRQRKLNDVAGFDVNTNSAAHLQRIFPTTQRPDGNFEMADGTFVPKTEKGGKPSINKDVLLVCTHPAAELVRGLKSFIKMRDTFLKGHILGNQVNGYIHATYNQTRTADEDDSEYGTTSGRLSCNAPNLQQISKRNPEIAAIVRSLFVPDPGQLWGCRDWSQMDFRIFAHYAQTPSVMAMYQANPNTDFHQMVADLTGLPRKATPGIKGDAKALNLGLCFGMGKGKMAEQMGLPYTIERFGDSATGKEYKKAGPEAEEVFARYHAAVPGVKALLEDMTAVARNRGFVRTGFGRRIRFPKGDKVYKAGAMIFQGTAADALKLKLVEVYDILQGTNSRLVANVHDEFDSSMAPGESKELDEAIREAVECFDGVRCPLKITVPIRSSGAFGPDWWEASK